MGRRVQLESLGGCLRPWRDGRLRALLARIQELRRPRTLCRLPAESPKVLMSGGAFHELPRPWLDDRLKKLVAHIELLRRTQLTRPS